jgi:hypothetical protein
MINAKLLDWLFPLFGGLTTIPLAVGVIGKKSAQEINPAA